jgi:hypothetical protein
LASVTGLILSIFINVVIGLCTHWHVPVIGQVERTGSDLGMLARAKLIPNGAGTVAGAGQIAQPNYVFFDVDEAACRAFAKGADQGSQCLLHNPISATLTAAFIRAAKKAHAAVAIVDVAPFESRNDRNVVMKSVDEVTPDSVIDTWVIAPVFSRFKDQIGAFWGDRSLDLAPCNIGGKLRLATLGTSTDPAAQDDKVRRAGLISQVFDANDPNATPRVLPTAPQLAASRLRAIQDVGGHSLIDHKPILMALDQADMDCGSGRSATRHSFAAANDGVAIKYSMPSLSQTAASELSQNESVASNKHYERLVASKSFANDQHTEFDLTSDQNKGAVIVLGSSQLVAEDLHSTPIGVMAGSEILLNAIRTLVEQPQSTGSNERAERNRWGRVLAEKGVSLFIGFLVMTFTWLAIYYVHSRPTHAGFARHALRIGAMTMLFLLGMSLSLLAELWSLTQALRSSNALGDVDVLTPVFALGVEGYTEAMKWLLATVEYGLSLAAIALLALKKGHH